MKAGVEVMSHEVDSIESKSNSQIVDFGAFKKKKETEKDLAAGRNPLYVSHLDGKIKGSPHLNRPEAENFGDRLQRIRTSLEKINSLISELKKMSGTQEGVSPGSSRK